MSMISHQCDELRERAETLRMLSGCMGAPRIVSSAKKAARNTMVIAASEMQEAADTIWELRCKLAGTVDQREEIERLKAESAKLRELVRKWYPHMLKRVGRDALEQWGQMDVVKELGIEVDG